MSIPSNPEDQGGNGNPESFSQDVQFSNVSARVPEKVARGVFSTGVLVLQGPNEFALDFVLRMNQPHQVVAHVLLPLNLMPLLIDALQLNLENYRKAFGAAPPAPPMPPPAKPPNIEEIYQDLKLTDDVMAGAYANAVMVVHTPSEFCLEFILNLYPKAVITARVFLSAPQVPVLLKTLTQSWQNLQDKTQRKPPH